MSQCPTEDQLASFSAGLVVEPRELETISEHVEHCDSCTKVLARIESLPNRISRTIRKDKEVTATNNDGESVDGTFEQVLIESANHLPDDLLEKTSQLNRELATPTVLGEYVLLEKIGQGGMGQVFKAEHRYMKRCVAIKLLSRSLMSDEASIQRFRREVEAAARLSHPNIVRAYDAGFQDGIWYLVMEYIDGRNLAEFLDSRGPLPVIEAIDYILQATRGLAYAHSKGVIHRDIKLSNLMLERGGVVKVLDMGLARFDHATEESEVPLTASNHLFGTIDYMSPEQAANSHEADERSDIYSLGCSLFRLLTGANIYPNKTIVKKILAHASAPIPSLQDHRTDVDEELERIYRRMVAKDPNDRFPTAKELLFELENCLHSHSINGSITTPYLLHATRVNSDVVSEAASPHTMVNQGHPRFGSRLWILITIGCVISIVASFAFWPRTSDEQLQNRSGKSEIATTQSQVKTDEPTEERVERDSFVQNAMQPYTAILLNEACKISVPSITDIPNRDGPFTLELFVVPSQIKGMRRANLIDFEDQLTFRISSGDGLYYVQTYRSIGRVRAETAVAGVAGKRDHVAAVSTGRQLRVFVNGRMSIELEDLDGPLDAARDVLSLGVGLSGELDEIRISTAARYHADFVPTPRHEPDADTLVLFHCDESSGKVLKDSSGNGHDATIIGTDWSWVVRNSTAN